MTSTAKPEYTFDRGNYAGRTWYYLFRRIPLVFEEDACAKVASRLLQKYSESTKAWSVEKNTEWVDRLYMSTKLIMLATLHVNSLSYASARNVRIVAPYLRYYAVLSLLRAICYSLPYVEWNGGELISISHKATIDNAITHINRFDKNVAKEWRSNKS